MTVTRLIRKQVSDKLNSLRSVLKMEFDNRHVSFQKFQDFVDQFYPFKTDAGDRRKTWDECVQTMYWILISKKLIKRPISAYIRMLFIKINVRIKLWWVKLIRKIRSHKGTKS